MTLLTAPAREWAARDADRIDTVPVARTHTVPTGWVGKVPTSPSPPLRGSTPLAAKVKGDARIVLVMAQAVAVCPRRGA